MSKIVLANFVGLRGIVDIHPRRDDLRMTGS